MVSTTLPPPRVSSYAPAAESTLQCSSSQNQIAVMLRVAPTCSTPIIINTDRSTYYTLLEQIQMELYARAPYFATGFEFENLYVEWDQRERGFPSSSKLDQENFEATIALLRVRQGKADVLCIRARVTKADVQMKLVH